MFLGQFKKSVLNSLEATDTLSQYIWGSKIHKKLWPGTWDLTSLVLKKTLDENIDINFKVNNYLDIGCGHVALFGQYVKKKYPKIKVTSTDMYDEVIRCSQINIQKNNLDINLFKSDLFENIDEKFDLITSNLPYVSTSVKQNIPVNSVRYNSKFSGTKGTELTELFLARAKDYLTSEGRILLGVNCFYIPENICLKLIKKYDYGLKGVTKMKFNTSVVFIIR